VLVTAGVAWLCMRERLKQAGAAASVTSQFDAIA
jgi:hypothetical protein